LISTSTIYFRSLKEEGKICQSAILFATPLIKLYNNYMVMGYDSKNPIVRFYFRSIISTVVKFIEKCPNKELILDFGCGQQFLKKNYHFNVIGYDIIPEYTDVKNYVDLKPDIIICNHSLEHLSKNDLIHTLNNFLKIKPKNLIIALPTENIFSKIGSLLFRPGSHRQHKTKASFIEQELAKRFYMIDKNNLYTLTVISNWKT